MSNRAKLHLISDDVYQLPFGKQPPRYYPEVILHYINQDLLPILLSQGIKRGDLITVVSYNTYIYNPTDGNPDWKTFPHFMFTGEIIDFLADGFSQISIPDEFPLGYWSDYLDHVYGQFDINPYESEIINNMQLIRSELESDSVSDNVSQSKIHQSQFTHKSGNRYKVYICNCDNLTLQNKRFSSSYDFYVLSPRYREYLRDIQDIDVDNTLIIYM